MRKIVVAVLSAIVVGLMLVPSGVSAGSNTVSFTDRQGDLGKPTFGPPNGDPLSWWSGNSPISNAGYLDFISGWVSVKGGAVTMGLTVASPLTADIKLPSGVNEVRWAWFFYRDADVLNKISPNLASYGVYILWDGADFSAALVDRTSGSMPFALTYLDSFIVNENILTVTISSASISGAVAWFCESQIMNGPPWPLDGTYTWGSWGAPDITDWQLPATTYWPWQAMP